MGLSLHMPRNRQRASEVGLGDDGFRWMVGFRVSRADL